MNPQRAVPLFRLLWALSIACVGFSASGQGSNVNVSAQSNTSSNAAPTNQLILNPASVALSTRLSSDGVSASLLSGQNTNQQAVSAMIASQAADRDSFAQAHPPPDTVGALQPQDSGFVGVGGPHSFAVAGNLNTGSSAAIALQMPDGQTLSSQIAGVAYYVPGGDYILIGQIQDTSASISSDSANQVVFANAFSGISADVSFTYTHARLSQTVVFRAAPPSPSASGLDPALTQIAVLTAFLQAPAPVRVLSPIDLSAQNRAAGITGASSLYDETILWKTMKMIRGKAFDLGGGGAEIPVGKAWTTIGQQTVLVESTPYALIKPLFDALSTGSAPPAPTATPPSGASPGPASNSPPSGAQSLSLSNSTIALFNPRRAKSLAALFQESTKAPAAQMRAAIHVPNLALFTSPSWPMARGLDLRAGASTPALIGSPRISNSARGNRHPREAGVAMDYEIVDIPLLNINFGGHNGDEVGFAAIGDTTNDFWNGYYYPGYTSQTIYDLLYSDQSNSGVNLTVTNAPGLWGNSTADAMYNSFIYPLVYHGSAFVELDNLPPGAYDFWCYGHSQLPQDNSFFTVTTSTETYPTLGTQDSTLAASSANWVDGVQYVVITNVLVGNDGTAKITVSPGDGYYGILNGLQVVSTLGDKPAILVPPVSQVVTAGATATFSVGMAGISPFTYQWQLNSNNIAGATNASLALINVQPANAGYYTVLVTNAYGSTASQPAYLTVLSPGASLIDINFGDANTDKVGFAACGLASSDYWNCYQHNGQSLVTVTNMKWSDGASADVDIAVSNAPGLWGNSTGDPMYDTFIYPFPPGTATVTISNLATGTYCFYCYGHSQLDWDNTHFHVQSGSYISPVEQTQDSHLAATSSNWQENVQFVVLRNVPVTAGVPVIVTAAQGDGTAILNGMQILMPAPSALTQSEHDGIPDLWKLQYGFNPHDPTIATNDPDHDGLTNLQEYQHGTDPTNPDTDYDGRTDGQEVLDGTDPLNPQSVLDVSLGVWRFDTTTWQGEQGQLPITATGLSSALVPGIEADAVDMSGPNGGKLLVYHHYEPSSFPNINLRRGTVRFWFQPVGWSSVSQGGNGLGAVGNLISVGTWNPTPTTGAWRIVLDSTGDLIQLGTQDNAGNSSVTPWGTVPGGMVAGQWHQIAAVFSPTSAAIYVDATLVCSNAGLANIFPPRSVRDQGFAIGTDNSGAQKSPGAFDLMDTFNYPLSAAQIGVYSNQSVSGPPIVTATISIYSPLDVKWEGASIYVLSSYGISEYDTNGNALRTLFSVGLNPSGLDADTNGNVYVAMTGKNQVWKFNPTATSFQADPTFNGVGYIGNSDGSAGTNNGAFSAPYDVAVTDDGSVVYVSDTGNQRIQEFNKNGVFILAAPTTGSSPKGITRAPDGELFVADSSHNQFVQFYGDEVFGTFGIAGTAAGQFQSPMNASATPQRIYVADTGNNRIQKLDRHAFSPVLVISQLGLNQPNGVSVAADPIQERLAIADTGNNRVLLVSLPRNDPLAVWSVAQQNLIAGNTEAALAQFSLTSIDDYRAFLNQIGTNQVSQNMSEIGQLTPLSIDDDVATYYFFNTIDGLSFTFVVNFGVENGTWKIESF